MANINNKQVIEYSFWWSEARLVVAAIALFLGGVPPVYVVFPFFGLVGIISSLLRLSWIVSGAAAGLLIYEWSKRGQMLFGKRDPLDKYAFFVMAVSGVNLGITGLFGYNVGLSISSFRPLLLFVGLVYLLAGGYLWKRWQESGKNLF